MTIPSFSNYEHHSILHLHFRLPENISSNSCHFVSRNFPRHPQDPHDSSPFDQVRFIPSWIPGAGFKRDAQSAGREMARLEALPFQRAIEQIVCRIFVILRHKQTPSCFSQQAIMSTRLLQNTLSRMTARFPTFRSSSKSNGHAVPCMLVAAIL